MQTPPTVYAAHEIVYARILPQHAVCFVLACVVYLGREKVGEGGGRAVLSLLSQGGGGDIRTASGDSP